METLLPMIPHHPHHPPHSHTTHPQIQSLWRGDQLHPQDWVCHVQCAEHKGVCGDPTPSRGRGNVLDSFLLSQGLGRFLTGNDNGSMQVCVKTTVTV